jgi:hypothetical protein
MPRTRIPCAGSLHQQGIEPTIRLTGNASPACSPGRTCTSDLHGGAGVPDIIRSAPVHSSARPGGHRDSRRGRTLASCHGRSAAELPGLARHSPSSAMSPHGSRVTSHPLLAPALSRTLPGVNPGFVAGSRLCVPDQVLKPARPLSLIVRLELIAVHGHTPHDQLGTGHTCTPGCIDDRCRVPALGHTSEGWSSRRGEGDRAPGIFSALDRAARETMTKYDGRALCADQGGPPVDHPANRRRNTPCPPSTRLVEWLSTPVDRPPVRQGRHKACAEPTPEPCCRESRSRTGERECRGHPRGQWPPAPTVSAYLAMCQVGNVHPA